MTRTHIIAGDGTRFVAQGTARRTTRRLIGAAALITTALFLSAAVIGLNRAAIAPATPSHTDLSILATARNANPDADCALEWNESQQGFEAICTPPLPANLRAALALCDRTPRPSQGACIALALRPAYDIANTHTPNGIALVKECLADYRGAELISCLTQPIN